MDQLLNNMNNDDIIVDDNLISLEKQNHIKSLLTAEHFPWFLGYEKTSTTHPNWTNHFNKLTNNIFEYSQFVHLYVQDGKPNSDFINDVASIFLEAVNKYNIDDRIIRIKSNYCTKVSCDNIDAHQSPHVDCQSNHWVMIYYVNDSDGDTFIFNEKLEHPTPIEEVKSLSIKQRITPKQGRVVIFDGAHLHAGMHPRLNDSRMVINYVFPK